MAVVVTDNRTVEDDAEVTTNWQSGTASTDAFVEAANAIANAFNIATAQEWFTRPSGTSDVSNAIIYVWAAHIAILDTLAAGGLTLMLGDGTNRVGFHLAGGDRLEFHHFDGPVIWQCMVLDGSKAAEMDAAGLTTEYAGTFAALDLTAITQFGAGFITFTKALGSGFNCFVDIIRHGNDGISITGGTIADRGNFDEIVAEDRNTADGKAHGVIRALSSGVYGIQGPLTFGGQGEGDSWFDDTDTTLIFEDRNIGDDKYIFKVVGSQIPGSISRFSLSGSLITTAGPLVLCDFSDLGIDRLRFTNCTFKNLGRPVLFANDPWKERSSSSLAVGGSEDLNHQITNCTFDGCGMIDPGKTVFKNNTIRNSAHLQTDWVEESSSSAKWANEAALLLDSDGSSDLENLAFTSGGTGHAVLVTKQGSYTLKGFTYNGYGANDTTDAALFNNSGGLITITITGGDTPTVCNGAGASTIIISAVDITLTGLKNPSEVRVFEEGTETEIAGTGVENETTGTQQFTFDAGQDVDISIL